MVEFIKYMTSSFWVFIGVIVLVSITVNPIFNFFSNVFTFKKKIKDLTAELDLKRKELGETRRHCAYLTTELNQTRRQLVEESEKNELRIHKAFSEYSDMAKIPIDGALLDFITKQYKENE